VALRFHDRRDAGRQLAALLTGADLHDPVVLALPRGGVPVGAEVAAVLHAPLDVLVVRKIGAPGRPEYGIGAIAEGGEPLFDPMAVRGLGISDAEQARLADAARREVERRVERYRAGRPLPEVAGREVVVIDDGLATGVTAEAALQALAGRGPRRLTLAVPVCAAASAARLRSVAQVVCVSSPEDFRAVGLWYEVFDQTGDREVLELLAVHARART
jgi:predicted phosphoribosyltransferase